VSTDVTAVASEPQREDSEPAKTAVAESPAETINANAAVAEASAAAAATPEESKATASVPTEAAVPAEESREADAEVARTAAAWATWNHVHATVVDATSKVAEEAVATMKELAKEQPSEPEKEALAAAAAASSGSTSDSSTSAANDPIASI